MATSPQNVLGRMAAAPKASPAPAPEPHRAWVWKFDVDGDPAEIRDTLAERDIAVVLKTHDGTDWQATFDRSRDAISGPRAVERIARFCEDGGVPFHAWCVVCGDDPVGEARTPLRCGGRSLSTQQPPR